MPLNPEIEYKVVVGTFETIAGALEKASLMFWSPVAYSVDQKSHYVLVSRKTEDVAQQLQYWKSRYDDPDDILNASGESEHKEEIMKAYHRLFGD